MGPFFPTRKAPPSQFNFLNGLYIRKLGSKIHVVSKSTWPFLFLLQIDRLQAKLSGYLPKVVDLKATIEEINQRGEKEARQNEELLRQTAEKLKEQERQAKEKEVEKEKEEEEETKREREKKAATTVEGGSAKDSDGGSGDKGKATAVSEPTDCKLLIIVNWMTAHIQLYMCTNDTVLSLILSH